jgi:hypothetical protein
MQFTPLCHTDPIRAELELQEFGRAHFVENWVAANASQFLSLPSSMGLDCIEIAIVL